jgi:hypothetical protein
LKNFIAVTFPEAGLTYELPLGQLAGYVADAMAKTHPEWLAEDVAIAVRAYFEDTANIADLGAKLTWADMRRCARLVECADPAEPAIEAAVWSEGYDEPRSAALPPDPAIQGSVPLDLHLSVMWQLGAKVSAQVFTDSAGQATGAMIFVGGNKEQVDAYLTVCAQLCTQMTEHPEGAAPPVRQPFKH